VPDLRFSLNPSLNLIERRRDGKRGGFLEVGDRDDNLIELGEGDEGWRGWRGRGEDMVKQHRNRNDRLSKLICTVHDNKMAASSHWRLGQARGGRKRTGESRLEPSDSRKSPNLITNNLLLVPSPPFS